VTFKRLAESEFLYEGRFTNIEPKYCSSVKEMWKNDMSRGFVLLYLECGQRSINIY